MEHSLNVFHFIFLTIDSLLSCKFYILSLDVSKSKSFAGYT